MNPKFVLVSSKGDHFGTLRFGKVWNHVDLVLDGEIVHGGGWYERDDNKRVFILYGSSFDFGKPDMTYLDCIPSSLKEYKFYFSHEPMIFPDSELSEIDLSRIKWV